MPQTLKQKRRRKHKKQAKANTIRQPNGFKAAPSTAARVRSRP